MTAEGETQICHRCGGLLKVGEHYVVRIEGFVDPEIAEMPEMSREESQRAMKRLIDDARGLSEQELLDQVHRRLTIRLCTPCYRRWIENPAGAD